MTRTNLKKVNVLGTVLLMVAWAKEPGTVGSMLAQAKGLGTADLMAEWANELGTALLEGMNLK